MRKAEKTIETDLFKLIVASPIASLVDGKVYRKNRPKDSEKEDVIIKFITGLEGQIQNGVIIMNIYVKDIPLKGFDLKVENSARVETIENAIINFFDTCPDTEYLYEFERTPYSTAVEGLEQHVITTRIYYQRIIN